MSEPRWFRIEGGEHAGKLHLQGWMDSALETLDGWVAYSTCPRCFAWVGKDGAYGDRVWAHERWHAETDYPVPAELLRASEVNP